jgi:hypothetical protein
MSDPFEDPHLSLTQKENKDREEINIFIRFCKASHLPVVQGTAVHQKEPLLDIRCDLEAEGSVEFELMRQDNEQFLKDTRGDRKVAGSMRTSLFTSSLHRHMHKDSPSSLPKEFLIYILDQPIDFKGEYREWLREYFERHIESSIYRRAWFFNSWDKDYFQVRDEKKLQGHNNQV